MADLTIQPAPFVDYLLDRLPVLANLSAERRLRMIELISNEQLRKRYQHRKGRGITYPAEKLSDHFGNNYRSIMEQFFEIDDSYFHDPTNKARSYTKRYILRQDIKKIVDTFLQQRSAEPCKILVNGKPYRKRSNAISSRDINGSMKKNTAKISPPVPVNVENLHALERYLSRLYDTLTAGSKPRKSKFSHIYESIQQRSDNKFNELRITEIWLRITGELIRLSNVKPLEFGNLLQLYQETSTGRIQGKGIHLQTVPRQIRYEALKGKGLYQYDIDNCHYQVLDQISPIDLPAVKNYNRDKNAFRRAISERLGVDMDQVKTALISIIYGATDAEGYSLSDTLGDKTEQFISDQQNLFKDIKSARKLIIENADRTKRNQHGKFILNAVGKPISESEPANSKLAHILQGYEAFILNSILEIYSHNVRLLLFDGFISDTKLNASELEFQIKKQTGFSLKISEEKLM